VRIGVIGPVFDDSFADNVVDSLRRMGNDVDALGSTYRTNSSRIGATLTQLAQGSAAAASRLQRSAVARATNRRYDVIITVEGTLMPDAVRQIRHNGSRVALWFGDAVSGLGRQFMFLADYDLLCFKDSELVRRCTAMLDAPVLHLPEACNPSWHRPSDVPIEPIIVVAGNMHPYRLRFLERLARAGIPLRLYGPRWPRWLRSSLLEPRYTGEYLARDDKARVFRAAGAVLNTLHPGELASINCRLFEAAGCGAAVLTETRPDLAAMFDTGTEVQAFDCFDEAVDRLKWMLDHPEEARAMGDRAAKRAHAEHTYDARLGVLLGALG
jgi:spore maturation protein CgeB